MTNNFPEMFIDDNGNQAMGELSFAPAEGNYPTNLLQEKDWDIKSWPALHPSGRFGLHYKRKTKLTDQQFFAQRILNEDDRFSRSPSYIFSAAAYIEQKQLSSRANISFMRGKKHQTSEGKSEYTLDDAFTTFEGIKNTPKYWQKVKYDMIAKLHNIGPFNFFFTLSCGDIRYDENFSSFLRKHDYIIKYELNDDKTPATFIQKRSDRSDLKTLAQFLSEDVNESPKKKLIKKLSSKVLRKKTVKPANSKFKKDLQES